MHRDIKPENLLHVDASEEAPVKVCDFGLSVFYGGAHPKTKGTGGTHPNPNPNPSPSPSPNPHPHPHPHPHPNQVAIVLCYFQLRREDYRW